MCDNPSTSSKIFEEGGGKDKMVFLYDPENHSKTEKVSSEKLKISIDRTYIMECSKVTLVWSAQKLVI